MNSFKIVSHLFIFKSTNHPTNKKTPRMWGYNHYRSNILNKSANFEAYISTLSRLKPFVTDIKIAVHSNNKPIKIQRLNVPNFSNYLKIP